jgi:hypothetical protein
MVGYRKLGNSSATDWATQTPSVAADTSIGSNLHCFAYFLRKVELICILLRMETMLGDDKCTILQLWCGLASERCI